MATKRYPCVVWQDGTTRLVKKGAGRYLIEYWDSLTLKWRDHYLTASNGVWVVLGELADKLPNGPLASPDDPGPVAQETCTA